MIDSKMKHLMQSVGFKLILFGFTVLLAFVYFATAETLKSETYIRMKNTTGLKFDKVNLGQKLSEFRCLEPCNENSECEGVGIRKSDAGSVNCFLMMENPSGSSEIQDEAVYLKGINFCHASSKIAIFN